MVPLRTRIRQVAEQTRVPQPVLEREGLTDLLHQKSAHRGVRFRSLDDFFPEALMTEVRTHWNRSLGPFVSPLPACEEVMVGLRSLLAGFFPALKPNAWR
jgi:hypothetical protein